MIDIPVSYLLDASENSLSSLALSRLNRAANLRKEIAELLAEFVNEKAEAILADWLREHRNELRGIVVVHGIQESFDFEVGEPPEREPETRAPRRFRADTKKNREALVTEAILESEVRQARRYRVR